MGRSPCCEKAHTNKGAWSPEEDQLLLDYILRHGQGCWRSLPKSAGLLRCGWSCRLRWMNYLRPDLKRGNFTEEEDELIIKLHSLLGNKWSLIAGRLPGRTDNEIKNYWNTHIKRKLLLRGVDPQTHRPIAADGKPQPELEDTPLPVLETSAVSHLIDFGKSGSGGDSYSMEGGPCSSGTTTTTTTTTDEGGKIDLELSIGLFGFRSSHSKASSACSTSNGSDKDSVVGPTEAVAVKSVCLCCQLGFQGGQVCSGCQTTKVVL